MPNLHSKYFRFGALCPGLMALSVTLLAACVPGAGQGVTKMGFGRGAAPADPPTAQLSRQGEVTSSLIDELQSRRSILDPAGPYGQVASAVLDAGAGVAAAELRVARLKAEAKSKNWLPKIGPDVSLTSLGTLAASILIDQALFDGGARKAERAYAAADVEVAAITLATETNNRVYAGLKQYLAALRATDQAMVSERSVSRLTEFERIMRLRVEGGLSDRSEERVLSQKLAEMQAMASADRQSAANARAELAAMTSRSLAGISGLQVLPQDQGAPEPLAVIKSRGEGQRTLAEAQLARAQLLPGVNATARVGEDGVHGGLGLSGGNFDFGSSATREAIEATPDLVDRRNAQAAEDANRRITALASEMQSLQSREAQGAEVLRQTAANLSMFTEQYKVGRRSLLELVQQYESFAHAERDQVALKYLSADLRLQIALERGALVDGARM
ncbi:TolC family protein [Thioclava sp. FR2]|uniref:TolC family protein n=1 Tax=Thioclava sp. FR2 TaxID=3445780 RepID=UPI003EB6998F